MKFSMIYNAAYIIESHKDSDGHPGKELHDDALHWKHVKNSNFSSRYFNINSKSELLTCFDEIMTEVLNNGAYPIIHFDMHGNKEGIQLKDSSLISWGDIKSSLQKINIAMCNNLLVCMASCHGLYLSSILVPTEPAPAFGIIGSPNKINFDESLSAYREFYEKLLSTTNFIEMLEALGEHGNFTFINCITLFTGAFKKYIDEECTNDRIVARTMESFKNANVPTENNNDILGDVVAKLLDTKGLFNKYKRTFFMIDICPANESRFTMRYEDIND